MQYTLVAYASLKKNFLNEKIILLLPGNKWNLGKLEDLDWHIHSTIYKLDNSKGNSTQNTTITYMG